MWSDSKLADIAHLLRAGSNLETGPVADRLQSACASLRKYIATGGNPPNWVEHPEAAKYYQLARNKGK